MKLFPPSFRFLSSLAIVLLISGFSGFGQGIESINSPAENPPIETYINIPTDPSEQLFVPLATPTTEWTLHKTEDGAHPSGLEQAMVWLTNRARTDPEAEGVFLGGLTASNVISSYSFFGVDLNKMMTEFAALESRPPAAFDRRLWDASRLHSEFMITDNEQSHDGQFAKVDASGFRKNGGAVSVFWTALDPIHGHAALNVDWGGPRGPGEDGMQTGRGHRAAIMANPIRQNFGLAIVEDNDPGTQAGPLVTSIAYAAAQTFFPDHFNKFLVGTVWEDGNENGLYDDGEGLSGVTVMPDTGTYFAVTGIAGGFTIPIIVDDDYVITFSGGDLAEPEIRLATVDGQSALVIWNDDDSYVAAPAGPAVRPNFKITKVADGIVVEWTGLPEHTYRLQKGSGLLGWDDDGRPVEADGATRRVTIGNDESGEFFRLKVERIDPSE